DGDTLTAPDFLNRANWADKYRDSDRATKGPAYSGTSSWHFVDIPLSHAATLASARAAEPGACQSAELPGGVAAGAAGMAPAESCIVDKIRQFEAELTNPATPVREQILALKYIEHFIGDVHQPFHAIDDDDKGGNCISVAEGPKGSESLHSYWDTGVVYQLMGIAQPAVYDFNAPSPVSNSQVETYAGTLATAITPAQKTAWEHDDPAQWAAESAVAAREAGYDLHTAPLPNCAADNRNAPLALSAGYEKKARAVATEQLEKAGVRLAFVLNRIAG
ncbi:MAG: S1/P1 nuclease, partial [Asticcacaulis sp.]